MILDEEYEEMDEEEINERNYITNYLEIYAEGEDIFSAAEAVALKNVKRK